MHRIAPDGVRAWPAIGKCDARRSILGRVSWARRPAVHKMKDSCSAHAAPGCSTHLAIMDFSFALRFFTLMLLLMLTLICIALLRVTTPLVMRRDAQQHPLLAGIRELPHERWPAMLTGAGIALLLVSFVLLAAAGCALFMQ
jgi:hypothetical protein